MSPSWHIIRRIINRLISRRTMYQESLMTDSWKSGTSGPGIYPFRGKEEAGVGLVNFFSLFLSSVALFLGWG